ncbi:MAG TPA: hypothetical protein VK034_16110, partial [Enhygromyxa sp.]|nr:hypothetical protein [Enhygromyxa sp.]
MSTPRQYFLSSLRLGFAAAITQPPAQGRHAEFDVDIRLKADRVTSGSVSGPAQTARMRVGLYGPGDVRGLAADRNGRALAIGKRHPAPSVGDFEPNFFPFVEFDEPDFAWRFSPDAMGDDGRLDPWLTLVVLRARARDGERPAEFTEGERAEHDPLPWIRVDARQLPDPAQVWRWTHVQLDDTRETPGAPPTPAQLAEILEREPWRVRCRCLCPRRLLPGSEYRALVVPTFELGRLAGRGLEPGPNVGAMDRAWDVNGGSIELPYYDAWSFRTGSRGDFEHAVRRLTIRQLSTVELPAFDGSQPGFGLPSADPNPSHQLEREGALRPAGAAMPNDRASEQFRGQLAQLLDQSGGARLTPPPYGRWHAARNGADPKSDNWFDELNLDPRYRAAAALGAQVVRRNQSALMSSAWDQLGELDITEELLRRAWLAREAMTKLYSRLLALPTGALLSATGSMQSRVRVDCPNPGAGLAQTVAAALRERAVPAGCFDPGLRRLAARYARKRGKSGGGLEQLVPAIMRGQLHAADPEPPAAGALHVASIADGVETRLEDLCKSPDSLGPLIGLLNRVFNGGAQPPSEKVLALANQLRQASCDLVDPNPPGQAPSELPAEDVRAAVECGLDPERNVARQYQAATGLSLGPVLAYPVFPQPLYEQLREISTRHLLPLIGDVPPNTIAALETNRRFIEAFLCGAN